MARSAYKQLSLSQLRSFAEVCRRGGYAAAARALFLTSPAVWEQVKALERHYGLTLLERNGAGVRPTLHGERLLEMVDPLLAGLDSTQKVLRQEDGTLPEEISLITNMRVLIEELSRAVARFRRRWPAVRLRVAFTRFDNVEAQVRSGEADILFTHEPGPDSPLPASLIFEPSNELNYFLTAPRKHPLLRRRFNLRRVADYPLVVTELSRYSRHRIQEVLHRYHLADKLTMGVETCSDEYTLSYVRAGAGVGITIGTGRGELYRGLAVRSLRRWFGPTRVGFLWKRGTLVPPIQRELAATIQKCVGP